MRRPPRRSSSSPSCVRPTSGAANPQGKQLAEMPLVEIVKIGDSDPEPFTPAARPLSGLRVLSATHVIAGNVMSRTLAEHGAEVLQIAHPEEFEHEALMQDPCAGFTSSVWLDLNQPEALQKAYELAAGADVFVESYRTRKISNLGLSPRNWPPAAPASSTPPHAATATTGRGTTAPGLTWKRSASPGSPPKRAPVSGPRSPDPRHERLHRRLPRRGRHPAALIRRAKEGGSYHVRVNLARCAMWFMSLGKFDRTAQRPPASSTKSLPRDSVTAQTPYGELVRLAPPVKFSETKPYWQDPVLVVRGSSKAQWKDS